VSVAWVADAGERAPEVLGGDDADHAEWLPVDELPPLAFDHDRIVADALARLERQGRS
jgi:8-oxo-dGTP diphosphatase